MGEDLRRRKKELMEIGMLDEVLFLIRDCVLHIMDIRFIKEDLFFENLKDYLIKHKFWLREGIGEELLDEIMWELETVPYSEENRNEKIENITLYEEKLKEIREKFSEDENKIYH